MDDELPMFDDSSLPPELNVLMVRLIAGELAGLRTDPEPGTVIRTVGRPPKPGRQE